jgi:DNA-binding MarR family transcriptional regulator
MTTATAHCMRATPATKDERALRKLLQALEPFAGLRSSIPLPYVTAFLTVALDEGKGVCAYARTMGISRAAMSRYLRDIGDRARNGGPGLVLVTIDADPMDSRRRRVFLTAKGRSIAGDAGKLMRRSARSGRAGTAAKAGGRKRKLMLRPTALLQPV